MERPYSGRWIKDNLPAGVFLMRRFGVTIRSCLKTEAW
jgi:hypothetical protein